MTAFGHDPWWLVLGKALAIFVFLMLNVLVAILLERKILGWMQLRPGPNRAGPWGILQSLADGIKLALKESITPGGVDKFVYFAAPVISTIPAFTAFAFIPFGPEVSVFGHRTPLQLTDLPVAVLFILGLSAIGVYGIVLGGWASGSTYPLLGGVRSTAQVISYEVAMGLSFAAVFLYAGTMSTSEIVAAQDRVWYVFLLLPSFVIYLISMVGETNRAPFDLPEAEGELVAGFHTEYSSLKFAMFMLAEYVNMMTVSSLATRHVLRRLACPLAAQHVGGGQHRLVAGALVHRQDVDLPVHLYVAAGQPAPAALRPVHGAGLEAADPRVAGVGDDRGGDPHAEQPGLPALDPAAGGQQHRLRRGAGAVAAKAVQRAQYSRAGARAAPTARKGDRRPESTGPAFPTPPLPMKSLKPLAAASKEKARG